MGQPIQRCPGEPLAAQHLRPVLEGQIGGHDQAGPLVGRADHIEQQLRPQLARRDVAQLVEDQQVQLGQLTLHPRELSFFPGFHQLSDQLGNRNQVVAPAITHQVLDVAFLVGPPLISPVSTRRRISTYFSMSLNTCAPRLRPQPMSLGDSSPADLRGIVLMPFASSSSET